MKSASFSQCRRLTVVTRKDGVTSAAVWDLEKVALTNRWEIDLVEPDLLPWVQKLGASGTLILWEQLDRLAGGYSHDKAKRAEVMNQRIALAERHLRLVFHRFMELPKKPLKLLLNGRPLAPLDPFARNHAATMMDPEETLQLKTGDVLIQSVTLPHHKAMTQLAWEDIGGPEGHLKSQGFLSVSGASTDHSWNLVQFMSAVRADKALQGTHRHSQQHGCCLEDRRQEIVGAVTAHRSTAAR